MNLTLDDKLINIGFRMSGNQTISQKKCVADIEQTLLDAILESANDFRLLSMIFSWIKVHGSYVIVEKFSKLISKHSPQDHPGMKFIPAIAVFGFEYAGYKWKKLIHHSKQPIYLFPKELTDSAIKVKGMMELFQHHNIIVPKNSLRIREEDVLSPKELIKRNRQYKNRYIYGPSWRADIISMIERGFLSPIEISKALGCSYEPAYRILKEYQLAVK